MTVVGVESPEAFSRSFVSRFSTIYPIDFQPLSVHAQRMVTLVICSFFRPGCSGFRMGASKTTAWTFKVRFWVRSHARPVRRPPADRNQLVNVFRLAVSQAFRKSLMGSCFWLVHLIRLRFFIHPSPLTVVRLNLSSLRTASFWHRRYAIFEA